MKICEQCKQVLGRYGGSEVLMAKIEITTRSSEQSFYFDTKSCMARWVTESYVSVGNNTY